MINVKITLGVIISNRDFFPDVLITEGRKELLAVLDELGIGYVLLGENDTPLGAIETWEHAKKCGALFQQNAGRIDGILISLPNFGDEKGVADSIKLSGLNVPILIQAYPDELDQFHLERRRDAFCGKISVCNNLYQYDYPFSVTTLHTVSPKTDSFKADLRRFVAVCRVVKGIRMLGWAQLVRVLMRSIPPATAKSCCRQWASVCRRLICRKFSAWRRNWPMMIRRSSANWSRSALMCRREEYPQKRSSSRPSWGLCWRTGWPNTTSLPLRSSVGVRYSRIMASTSAP